MYSDFSVLLRVELRKQSRSIAWLAEKCGVTYEHIRKLANGDATPSALLVTAISEALSLNQPDAHLLAKRSKIRRKYGVDVPGVVALMPKSPDWLELENLWPRLDPSVKSLIVQLARTSAPVMRTRDKSHTITYIARATASGLLKIGKTARLDDRVRMLEAGTGTKIEVLARIPGDREKELHARFNKYRRDGEWFEPAAEIQSYISSLT